MTAVKYSDEALYKRVQQFLGTVAIKLKSKSPFQNSLRKAWLFLRISMASISEKKAIRDFEINPTVNTAFYLLIQIKEKFYRDKFFRTNLMNELFSIPQEYFESSSRYGYQDNQKKFSRRVKKGNNLADLFNIQNKSNAISPRDSDLSNSSDVEFVTASGKKMKLPPSKAKAKKSKESTRPTPLLLQECFTRASLESHIELKKTASLMVDISLEELMKIKGKSSKISPGRIETGKPLRIVVRPAINCRISGITQKFVDAPQPGKPVNEKFKVGPTHAGQCKVNVEVWQEQYPICHLELEFEGLADIRKLKKKVTAKQVDVNVPASSPFAGNINQLRINTFQAGDKYFYHYVLDFRDLDILSEFDSPPLNLKPEEFVRGLYDNIETMWDQVSDDPRQFCNELRAIGSKLFMDLFPDEMRDTLYKNAGKLCPVQLISQESIMPWELVLLKNPKKQTSYKAKDRFLGELGLIRWRINWQPPDQLQIRSGKAKYIWPDYLEKEEKLTEGAKEVNYLADKFKAISLKPDPVKVLSVLKKPGSFDLLHFCCHGEADSKKIAYSQLRLGEKKSGKEVKPSYLSQLSVESLGTLSKDNSRPIVVLNTCRVGRLGKNLVGYGGFAQAFLKAKAGVFVGALWQIEDIPAADFIISFYDSLLSGATLAEATVTARKKAAEKEGATWISYTVYGHPFAKLLPNI